MRLLITFARFWYDFIVGDDWRLALGASAAIVLTFVAAHTGLNWWWILPLAVATLLGISIALATRNAVSPSKTGGRPH
jgi:hypothetical protein